MSAYKINDQELLFTFARSSGPGGQNVNKTNSKAVLVWSIEDSQAVPADVKKRFFESYSNKINKMGEVVISSEESRDRERNKENCKSKLFEMLKKVWLPPKKRLKTKPSMGAKLARLDSKKKQSHKKAGRGNLRSSFGE